MLPQPKIFYSISGLVLLSGWAWVLINLSMPGTGFTPCVIRNVTGLPCPSCGTTSSIMSIMHGNLELALLHNPIGYPAMAILAFAPVWLATDVLFKKTSLLQCYTWCETKLKQPPVLAFLLLLLGINWIWNLIK